MLELIFYFRFVFFFISNSLAYISIPKNNGKQKLTEIIKITATYALYINSSTFTMIFFLLVKVKTGVITLSLYLLVKN